MEYRIRINLQSPLTLRLHSLAQGRALRSIRRSCSTVSEEICFPAYEVFNPSGSIIPEKGRIPHGRMHVPEISSLQRKFILLQERLTTVPVAVEINSRKKFCCVSGEWSATRAPEQGNAAGLFPAYTFTAHSVRGGETLQQNQIPNTDTSPRLSAASSGPVC